MAKNVVYFFFDELRSDALECYGNPAGKMVTPNIDAIAARGTLFSRCYCNSPVCVPSRMSMLTGLYPEDTAVYGNEASLPPFALDADYTTIPDVFEANGYRTASFGKTHLPRDMKAFEVNNQDGSEMDCGLGKDIFSIEKISGKGEIRQNLGSIFPEGKEYTPEHVAKNAIAWLKENKEQPFFLRVSLLQPHTPVLVKEAFKDLYKEHDFTSEWHGTQAASKYEKRFVEWLASDTISEEDLLRMKQLYFALAAWGDTQVGLVMDYLKENNLVEDTIFVVNSDHGCNLGECSAYAKFLFSPKSQQVPLIVAAPGMTPKVEETICSNIDLGRTLFALAGIEAPAQFKGRDLLSKEQPENPAVYATIGYGEDCSYPLQYDAVGDFAEGIGWPRRACIRTQSFRLEMSVRVNGRAATEEEEDIFFTDCTRYPAEDVNLAADPAYADIVKELREQLLAHCAGAKECSRETLHGIEELLINKSFFRYLGEAKDKVAKGVPRA